MSLVSEVALRAGDLGLGTSVAVTPLTRRAERLLAGRARIAPHGAGLTAAADQQLETLVELSRWVEVEPLHAPDVVGGEHGDHPPGEADRVDVEVGSRAPRRLPERLAG